MNFLIKVCESTIHSTIRNFCIYHELRQTPETIDWITEELRWRACRYRKTGQVNVFDGVVKSDTAISPELRQELSDTTKPLVQTYPAARKKNNYQILVDPMSFPLLFGFTKVLMDGEIPLDECLLSGGLGSRISLHYADESSLDLHRRRRTSPYIDSPVKGHYNNYDLLHQCVPFDVKFTKQGCRIDSYINGLHPRTHAGTYEAIEKIISRAIPLWNESLSQTKGTWKRLVPEKVEFDPPMPEWGNERCLCDQFVDHQWPRSCPQCRGTAQNSMNGKFLD